MNKKKGFTLMELIIVLAIIGILVAILVPSWNYFIRRSRERTANAKAKIVFNAAQTEAIKTQIRERNVLAANRYMGSGEFYFYWDGTSGTTLDVAGNPVGTAADTAKFGRTVNNVLDTTGAYRVYINNYQVQSVVYATFANNQYIGAYPKSLDELSDSNANTIRVKRVQGIEASDMKTIALP